MLRPYLIITKLIEQPTWGGSYIIDFKMWQDKKEFVGKKIGQAYELVDKSLLSLLSTSKDPAFTAEITDPKLTPSKTAIPQSIALTQLIAENPTDMLGDKYIAQFGAKMELLIKFTQALGNSFQLHVKDGTQDSRWKPKPESWYYFEPGYITLGVKKDVDWRKYEEVVTEIERQIASIGEEVKSGSSSIEQAKNQIKELLEFYNPWQYVNTLTVPKDQLVDLSPCGIHHSWEEKADLPLGNVLYELQINVLDDICTIRNFDKGKMSADGTTRPIHIADYFKHIDRTPEANDPKKHMTKSKQLKKTDIYESEKLMESKYYQLDKINFKSTGQFTENIDTFRHVFVKSGSIDMAAGDTTIEVTQGHSAFVPAGCKKYSATAKTSDTCLLISY